MKKFFLCFSLLLLLASCGKSNTHYRIGVDPSFFPLDIKGKEANVFAFSNEVLQEISKLEKVRFERVNMSWDNLIWGLQEKKYEGILSSMYPYIFNKKKYSFSDLYLLSGPVLIVRQNMPVTSLEQMAGKEVAVESYSIQARFLDQYPNILPRQYINISQAFIDLLDLKIDGILYPVIPAATYVEDLYTEKLKLATKPLNDEGLRLVTLAEENGELIALFNKGLADLKKSGKYDELLAKWNLRGEM